MKLIKLSILLLVAAAVTHCTVQKRFHRNGYYVSWQKKSVHSEKKAGAIKTELAFVSEKTIVKSPENNEQVFASVKKEDKIIFPLKIKTLIFEKDTCGDLILMRDGSEVLAKVIEVGTDEIKYKRCDHLDGPLIISRVDKVFMIKYTSGAKDVFKAKEVTEPVGNPSQDAIAQTQKVKPKNNTYAIWSFVTFCLFFLLITIPISITLGIIALVQHKNHPDKYKNMWLAKIPIKVFCVILGLIAISALLSL